MKFLITGSAGFIGYHLCKSLLKKGHQILGIDSLSDYYDQNLKKERNKMLLVNSGYIFKKTNISNLSDVRGIFESFMPDLVINLAAQPGIRYSLVNPYEYVSTNIVGFSNIAQLCVDYDVNGLIYASSSSVYGDNNSVPFNVEDKAKPISLYGATKLSNEIIAYSYYKSFALRTTGLRFFTVYGPWYRPDMGIFIFIQKILSGDTINVFNDGNMYRDFTYVDDIVNGIEASINKNFKSEVFNLGNSKSENVMDVIHILENLLNKKAKIKFLPLQNGEIIKTFANIDHSKEKLNYEPKINIEDGLPYVIEWFRKYYNV